MSAGSANGGLSTGGTSAGTPKRVLVIGSGIAGLTAARHARESGHDVLLVTKHRLDDGCTVRAQGGVAGVVFPDDTVASHVADTLVAGAGHCDFDAVQTLCEHGGESIHELARQGVEFDTDEHGEWCRGLEGAHSIARIVHAGGDATGARIHAALVASARNAGVRMLEHRSLRDLTLRDGRVIGATFAITLAEPNPLAEPVEVSPPAEPRPSAEFVEVRPPLAEPVEVRPHTEEHSADAVILATGGFGALYPFTTNPDSATGDGIVIAARAGAEVADLEFMQFHPTVLAVGEPFLISEAVRGEGAILVDETGHAFMQDVHPQADLAPRDVVARAIAERSLRSPSSREATYRGEVTAPRPAGVYLDATALGADFLRERFPTIDAAVRARGLDWSREPIPVRPGAHFAMGGIVTDLWGRTTVPGLYAVGEVARTGVHGANRLASNSLLEGAVFGARVADAVGHDVLRGLPFDTDFGPLGERGESPFGERSARSVSRSGATYRTEHLDTADGLLGDRRPFSRDALTNLMWTNVGVVRNQSQLTEAARQIALWCEATTHSIDDRNLLELAAMVTEAALARTASIGAHYRSDAPAPAAQAPATKAPVFTHAT